MATRTKEEKDKARQFATAIHDEVLKIEKYLNFRLKSSSVLHPRSQEQMNRAKEAVYNLRVCLYMETWTPR